MIMTIPLETFEQILQYLLTPLIMEVEPFSYIFGSFSRRKQSSSDQIAPKTKPLGNGGESLTPQNSPITSPYSPPILQEEKCPLCAKPFLEPRVLKCLHTFCTNCLIDLLEDQSVDDASDVSNGEGIQQHGGDGDNLRIECPSCKCWTELENSVSELPLNYIILHRTVLATVNSPTTKLLCDFCPLDVDAKFRCTECALSLCRSCADLHRLGNKRHEVLELVEARRRGIRNVRRQIMCRKHPENELVTFCSACSEVLCTECSSQSGHKNHPLETPTKAVKLHTTNIRVAINRANASAEKSSSANARLEATADRIRTQCDQIEKEIEDFTNNYIQAVKDHRQNLFNQLENARQEKLQCLASHREELQSKLQNVQDAVRFSNDLLKEGSDIEVLTFINPIMSRLESCYIKDRPDLKISQSLQFLPKEPSSNEDQGEFCCPLYGVITTQTISVKNCTLRTDGLQSLRVGRRAEAILETKDSGDNVLQRGGEHVEAQLVHKAGGLSRSLPVHIDDKRDGTYRLSFVPDIAGKMLLSVQIKREALKDSPFSIVVRSLRPHRGTFHCCVFCSSGGNKDAVCGCQGRMPGGYKGCGHGHEGHPGRRHWSCCGNILEHSECVRTDSISHYQFSL